MAKEALEIEPSVSEDKRGALSPPAYFLALVIENVRCFGPQQRLDLSNGEGRPAQWTIILGNNGVGKTTILQSLVALTPVSATYDDVRYSGTRGMTEGRMGVQWIPKRYPNDSLFHLSADFFVGAKLKDRKTGRKITDFYLTEYKVDLRRSALKSHEELEKFVCFGYGASRKMGETSLSEKTEDNPFASLFLNDFALLNAEEWLLQANYTAHVAKSASARARAEKRRDEIKEVLINLLPDVTDIRFAQLTEKHQKPSVEVETPYGWVSIKDLSWGYKTLIAWMVDFASRMFDRYPDSKNPLAEPAVVLVDEIDLHLHPKWQRTLMSYLSERFPNTQFIATAHSPLVVQAATDANIVLLRRVGDHVVIENDVKKIHGWRVDQILTSDLFGLESARPPELDGLMAERTKLLSKSRLTKKDRARLEQLEAEIGSLPTGETPEDMEAMDIIRRAATRLKKEGRETSHDSGD
ncbi:MAG: AAA family ATPase [Acidobacteria bacterium]|nr:AAA family ATPase [Acidobacteriota bacterium]